MDDRALLRHALAVLAYRGGKTLRGAPETFPAFATGGRTPLQTVGHLADLLDWSLSIARGAERWSAAPPQAWEAAVDRFYASLALLDAHLASDAPVKAEIPRLLQGPIADALTHVGQLAMLRRMAGAPSARTLHRWVAPSRCRCSSSWRT